MSDSGYTTVGKPDSRAGTVGARERDAQDMAEGRAEWSTSRLEEWAATVYSVYIPSLLGRFFFRQKDYEQALKYLELARSREMKRGEHARLDEEIAEVKAAMNPQDSA